MDEKTQHIIYSELHAAIAEKGQIWVLEYLRKRSDADPFTTFLRSSTCAYFGVSLQEFLNTKKGIDARRVFASLLRKRGYSFSKIQAATNKSRSIVNQYIVYIAEIEASERLSILFRNTKNALAELEQKAEDYGKQRA